MALRQISLIKFKPGIPESQQQQIFGQLKRLDADTGANELGVVHIVEWSSDQRKADFAQETTFPNRVVLNGWHQHPAHREIVRQLATTADWWSALIDVKS